MVAGVLVGTCLAVVAGVLAGTGLEETVPAVAVLEPPLLRNQERMIPVSARATAQDLSPWAARLLAAL